MDAWDGKREIWHSVGIWRNDHWAHDRWYDVWWCELLREDWLAVREERYKAAGVTDWEVYPGCAK